MLAAARRTHGSASLLFIDLDNFKEVNDGFGHATGDELLAAVAARLRRVTRETDTVARLGGDEFVVLVENESLADASGLLAERVQDVLRPPFTLGGREYLVSASIGIATTSDGSAENLLQEADVAMYKAKSSGKNCCVSFRPRMRHAAHARLQLEMDLASAIHGGQLRVHYQPIFNLTHGDMCGMEALVRWQHPERGPTPTERVPPAGRGVGTTHRGSGPIRSSEACLAAAGWQRLDACLDVAVNISGRQLESGGIVNDVEGALAISSLDPIRLVLEVAETAMMHDPDAVVARMGKLKNLGVRLSVDDFGTGYSSLTSLRRFPVDVLKIDRSFIESISKSSEDASVVQTLVSLGRTLGLEVVAEGRGAGQSAGGRSGGWMQPRPGIPARAPSRAGGARRASGHPRPGYITHRIVAVATAPQGRWHRSGSTEVASSETVRRGKCGSSSRVGLPVGIRANEVSQDIWGRKQSLVPSPALRVRLHFPVCWKLSLPAHPAGAPGENGFQRNKVSRPSLSTS